MTDVNDCAVNRDYSLVESKLTDLSRDLSVETQILDTRRIKEADRQKLYFSIVPLSVRQRFQIRRVFGSRRIAASLFGLQVPALIIYEGNEENPIDVYPKLHEGRVITISEYLTKLEGRVVG
jgi:hypothetical protein